MYNKYNNIINTRGRNETLTTLKYNFGSLEKERQHLTTFLSIERQHLIVCQLNRYVQRKKNKVEEKKGGWGEGQKIINERHHILMSFHFEQHDFVSPTGRCPPLWVRRKVFKKSCRCYLH